MRGQLLSCHTQGDPIKLNLIAFYFQPYDGQCRFYPITQFDPQHHLLGLGASNRQVVVSFLLGFYLLFICDIIIVLNYKGIRKLVNKNSDFTLAVANLAAAAIAANPQLTMEEAVQRAREILRGTSVTPQQIEDSVQPDKIQCLEDGTWHVMLRRYIKRRFNLSPQQYREKWGLPDDYPFVAPQYARKRSRIAKKSGLGRR